MKTTRTVLDNGMIVLVTERHSAPVVAIDTWVNTGYFYEPDSLTGISHLLEHMFFKGTKKRTVGRLREETRELGWYLNAGTIYEYTHYYTVLPSQFVESGLELQSDALWNSVIDTTELEKEKRVVIEEVKRKWDNPNAWSWEKLMELAFDRHPIRRWRMGTPEQINNWNREQFEHYLKSYYQPDNIILSIAGEVKTKEVMKAVEKYYVAVKMDKTQRPQCPNEPKQKRLRYSQLKGDISQSYLKMGFHIPGRITEDYAVLDLLAHVLGAGRSSRLSQNLIEKNRLVQAIRAEAFGLRDLGVFIIEAELDAKDMQNAEVEIFGEIERIKTGGITDLELVKVKNAIKFSYLSSTETASGVAENLALFESYGDYRLGEEYLIKVEEVTADDIQKAVMRYLIPDNASILEYRPSKDYEDNLSATMIEERINTSLSMKSLEAEKPEKGEVETKPSKSQRNFAPSQLVNLPVKREKLSCGVDLVAKENHYLPLVSLGIYFKGGRVNESKENSGITQLVLKSSLKGTETKSASEIFNLLEVLGASAEVVVEADYFGYQLKILSENWEEGLKVIADVVKNPVFNPDELEKEKKILVAEIMKSQDNMVDYPVELFYQSTFPNHPYGLNSLGDEDAIESLNQQKVKGWHQDYLTADNMLIVAVGDFNPSILKERIETLFYGFNKRRGMELIPPQLESKPKANMVAENRFKAQTAQVLGFVTCSYENEDLYALKVLQAIASGGGGRFYRELREKRSLAYTVYGVNDSWERTGVFYAYIATSPENEELARGELTRQFYRFKTETVKDEELKTAQKYITGIYQIQLETVSALLKQYAKAEILGKGVEEVENYPQKINQVTKQQIREVANRYFLEENLTVGMVKGSK
ncbi:MAG TPA: pitrilysin family protein [candidate division Zixibacteria bacterium]